MITEHAVCALPDDTRHRMPGDDGTVPCCGRHVDQLPHGDWMTAGDDRVTCAGMAS